MKIIVAETAGFCWGVKRAIDKVIELRNKTPESIQTYGPLIHNPQILDQLENKGITSTEEMDSLRSSHVVVRTHGIPPDQRKVLQGKDVKILDTTCPDVGRIQARIKRSVKHGQNVIIAGHSGHAEVRGLMGYAGEQGFLVESVADVEKLPPMESVALVSQSTFSKADFAAITDAVVKRFPNSEVYNTICEATHDRQDEVKELAKKVEVMIVIGGRGSSNTNRLTEVSASLGTRTYHIETEAELEPSIFEGVDTVGVTAGASTPDWIISRVVERIDLIGKKLDRVPTGTK